MPDANDALTPLPGYPAITLGTMALPPEQTIAIVHDAIALGYRAFDTAPLYGNEDAVGEALRTAPITREELFLTTKLWNTCHGYDEALAAFDRTADRLKLSHVDLYLIHWPVPGQGLFVETWKALVRLREEGRVKAIGVSNFLPEHLERIIDATGVVPAANQIEVHPSCQQEELHRHCRVVGIATQAWSPFGHGQDLADPRVAAIARRHGRSPAQVILRWHVQRGILPVVKASSAAHLAENLDLGGFALSAGELAELVGLDRAASWAGVDPRTFVSPPGMEDYKP